MHFIKIFPIVFISSLVLISCGGSGGGSGDNGIVYTGTRTEATVDVNNAEKLAIAATGGASQAIAADLAEESNPLLPRGPGSATNSTIASTIAEHIRATIGSQNRTANAALADATCSSGSADQNITSTSSTRVAGYIIFRSCVPRGGNGEVLNGRVNFSAVSSDGVNFSSLTMRFVNFRVTFNGESETINMSMTCNVDTGVCNIFSDYVGPDGRTYRVADLDISFNSITSEYTVLATVFDPDSGFITIVANITYGSCVGGVPISGSITVTGDGITSTVVFNGCDSFTVTFAGVPTEYFWADIL